MQLDIVTILVLIIAIMIFVTMCASIINACNTENIKSLILNKYEKEKEEKR